MVIKKVPPPRETSWAMIAIENCTGKSLFAALESRGSSGDGGSHAHCARRQNFVVEVSGNNSSRRVPQNLFRLVELIRAFVQSQSRLLCSVQPSTRQINSFNWLEPSAFQLLDSDWSTQSSAFCFSTYCCAPQLYHPEWARWKRYDLSTMRNSHAQT